MQRKVRIGVDLDSTIARIDRPWLAKLNAMRGTAYRPEDWSDWDLTFLQPLDREIFMGLLTPDLYDSVEPYPGAAEAIAVLAQDPSVELVCVTTNPKAQSDDFVTAKRQWLQRHIPELANTLIVASSKSGLLLDVLIDDAPHHVGGDYISDSSTPVCPATTVPHVFSDRLLLDGTRMPFTIPSGQVLVVTSFDWVVEGSSQANNTVWTAVTLIGAGKNNALFSGAMADSIGRAAGATTIPEGVVVQPGTVMCLDFVGGAQPVPQRVYTDS
jgi:5'(3')-deoxyribonucleotidase